MSTQFAQLTDAQKQQFAADLAAVGVSTDAVPANITLDGTSNASFDPQHTVSIENLAHLKALAGVPDSHFANGASDSHVHYPAALPAERVRSLNAVSSDAASESLSHPEKQAVQASKLAYVTGHSAKVAPELAALANKDFPMVSPVSVVQDLVISVPTTLSGLVICGTITIKPGGVIKISKDTSIKAQVITKV